MRPGDWGSVVSLVWPAGFCRGNGAVRRVDGHRFGVGGVLVALLAVGGAVETVAVARRGKDDTFSETVWNATRRWPARVALAVFMVWLTLHFVFRL